MTKKRKEEMLIKRNKTGRVFALFVCMIFIFTGCGAMFNVYDDETKLASDSNSYNKVNYVWNQDGDRITVSCGKFEGMETIWKYNTDEDVTFDMVYNFKVKSGKAKLVLIKPDDTVEILTEISADDKEREQSGTFTLELGDGENRIKLVGSDAESISLDMTPNIYT